MLLIEQRRRVKDMLILMENLILPIILPIATSMATPMHVLQPEQSILPPYPAQMPIVEDQDIQVTAFSQAASYLHLIPTPRFSP